MITRLNTNFPPSNSHCTTQRIPAAHRSTPIAYRYKILKSIIPFTTQACSMRSSSPLCSPRAVQRLNLKGYSNQTSNPRRESKLCVHSTQTRYAIQPASHPSR